MNSRFSSGTSVSLPSLIKAPVKLFTQVFAKILALGILPAGKDEIMRSFAPAFISLLLHAIPSIAAVSIAG